MEQISESEYAVMEVIWSLKKPVTPNEVMEQLNGQKEWKYSTVRTFLARLTQKGLLQCEQGRVNIYTAIVSEKEYKRKETKSFLSRIHKGSLRSMIASLAKDDISDEKMEQLMKELDSPEDEEGDR